MGFELQQLSTENPEDQAHRQGQSSQLDRRIASLACISTNCNNEYTQFRNLIMITIIPFRPKPSAAAAAGFSTGALRWASYDKAALTKAALKDQVQSGLDTHNGEEKWRLNTLDKTISTAAGELPLSPLFNPDWMKARRRQRKDSPGKPTGRFRRKLANNPYGEQIHSKAVCKILVSNVCPAQALATPIRKCPNTATLQPRYFLQDFELVKHPEDDSPWWVPGLLGFENIENERSTPLKDKDGNADAKTAQSQPTPAVANNRQRRSPITSYALSRKSVIDKIGGRNRRHAALLLATRTGMAVGSNIKSPVWRQDMGDVLLHMMRRRVVDALISQAEPERQDKNNSIQVCQAWGDIKDVKHRGCVLLPSTSRQESSTQYATIDVEGAKYGQKLAVHNLHWLLGDSELERLRSASKLFHNDILVLDQGKSKSEMKLHLLLWRLQGYLAQPPEM